MSIKNKIDINEALADLNKPRGAATKVGITSALHKGQIELLAPLYQKDIYTLFGACGRKWGKTQAACYAAWREALTNPGSVTFLVGPEKDHLGRIYWLNKRLQNFLEDDSEKYIKKVQDREKLVHFKNGSIISLMGSENFGAGNGLTPDLIIYDEFKIFHPRFHSQMNPNRAAKGAKLFIIGTQPEIGDRNKQGYEDLLKFCQESPNSTSVIQTTFDNPVMHQEANKALIEQDILEARARGDEAYVQREYYSKIVPGGSRAIFPMFSKDRHVRRHEFIMAQLKDVEHQFEWYSIIDPSSTTYGGIFLAYHPKTKMAFVLDEMYVKDRFKTSSKEIGPVVMDKMRELNTRIRPKDWYKIGDQAAALHLIDISANFPDLVYMQSQKNTNNKDDMLMILKDMLTMDLLIFSDRAVNAIKEFEEYATSPEGAVIKNRHSKDHLIDCCIYFLHFVNYNAQEVYTARLDLPPEWSWFIKGFGMFGAEKTGELDELLDQEFGYRDDPDFDTF
jgi:hypothetical protein